MALFIAVFITRISRINPGEGTTQQSCASRDCGRGVRPNTISGMLSRLRAEGFDKNEQGIIDKIRQSLTDIVGQDAVEGAEGGQTGTEEPRVVILKRQR